MSLSFLTPEGVLLALGVGVPLVALFLVRRRARRVRNVLGLSEPSVRRLLVALAALLLAGVLVGLAAAQPVLERSRTVEVRTDAEVFVVLDISRSMLAQHDLRSARRFDRARTAASRLRAALAGVPVGLASLTDRVLPHLFPSPDEDVFEVTLERSLAIERPPPSAAASTLATSLSSLGAIRSLRYFAPSAKKRLVVVLTDGESTPVASARVGALFRRPPAIEAIFVHVWDDDERVYSRGTPEARYRPDPASRTVLERLADSTGGYVYSEDDLGAATQRARELLGSGPTVVEGRSGDRIALAPYLAAFAFFPLALLLARRDR
jgi:von Willebrand factor type A domain